MEIWIIHGCRVRIGSIACVMNTEVRNRPRAPKPFAQPRGQSTISFLSAESSFEKLSVCWRILRISTAAKRTAPANIGSSYSPPWRYLIMKTARRSFKLTEGPVDMNDFVFDPLRREFFFAKLRTKYPISPRGSSSITIAFYLCS